MSIDPDTYYKVQLALLVICVICMAAAIAVWAFVCLKARSRLPFRYCIFIIGLAACLVEQLHYVIIMFSHHMVKDATSPECILQETWLMFIDLISTSAMLAYVLLCIIMAYRNAVSTVDTVLAVAGLIVGSAVFCGAWSVAKYQAGDAQYCLDWKVTSSYEWILTTPRLFVPFATFCLSTLLLYQFLRLNTSLIKQTRHFKVIRHSCVLMLILSLYFMFYEVYFTSIMHVHEHEFLDAHYVSGFMFCMKGIILSFFYCFLDLEVLSYCFCSCVSLPDVTAEEDGEEQPLSGWKSSKEVIGQPEQPKTETYEVTQVSSFEHEVKPTINVQSRLMYGSLGSGK